VKVIRQVFPDNGNLYFMVWNIPGDKLKELFGIKNSLSLMRSVYPNVLSVNAAYGEYASCHDMKLVTLPKECGGGVDELYGKNNELFIDFLLTWATEFSPTRFVEFCIAEKTIFIRFSCPIGKNIEAIVGLDNENIFYELENALGDEVRDEKCN
jgi:hypothetical protein